jgi:hypothetical protein
MSARRSLLILLALAATTERAIAQPTPGDAAPEQTHREALLFGDDEPAQAEDGSAEAPGGDRASVSDAENDPLAIGGTLYLRSIYSLAESAELLDGALSTPALLDLYLDARPTSRLRAFVKARLDHVFSAPRATGSTLGGYGACLAGLPDTLSGPPPMDAVDPADISATLCPGVEGDDASGVVAQTRTRVRLDQLWLKFDLGRQVFFTVGQQRIKWGAARLWNPTDFINAERLDPLAIFDGRLGVPLLKVHVPFEASGGNLYALALLDQADRLGDVGGALRAEWVFGPTEITASVAGRVGAPLRLGADLSGGLGPLELRVEGAVTHGGDQRRWVGALDTEALGGQVVGWLGGEAQDRAEVAVPTPVDQAEAWVPQVVGSVEWGVPYGDEDTLYLTAEYFYNGAGYDTADIYPWLALQGDYVPLYAGRHYAGGSLVAPRPGAWNDTTLLISGIGNLSDRSFVARFDMQHRALTRLTVFAFAAVHLGGEGEFHQGFELPSFPGTPGVSVPAPLLDLGVWLSIDL